MKINLMVYELKMVTLSFVLIKNNHIKYLVLLLFYIPQDTITSLYTQTFL